MKINIVADLVHLNSVSREEEITPANEDEQVTQFELTKYNILYPLPYEQMDQRERLLFREKYTQNIRERENHNQQPSDLYIKSACLCSTCCSTQGLSFGVAEALKIPVCLELTIPLSIIMSCFLFGGALHFLPRKVIECPARSINYVTCNALDGFEDVRNYFKNNDLTYTNSEDNKKLKEEFKKMEKTRIFYDREKGKYYVAQSAISWDGKDIKVRDEEKLYPLSPDVLRQPPASLEPSPRNLNISGENLGTRTIPSQLEM
jgi:hypothetical protein